MNREHLRRARDLLGMTQIELGRKLGLSWETIAALEKPEALQTINELTRPRYTAIPPWMPYAMAWMVVMGTDLPWTPQEAPEKIQRFCDMYHRRIREVAKVMGVEDRSLRYWRTGRSVPPPYIQYAICWVLLYGTRDPWSLPYAN